MKEIMRQSDLRHRYSGQVGTSLDEFDCDDAIYDELKRCYFLQSRNRVLISFQINHISIVYCCINNVCFYICLINVHNTSSGPLHHSRTRHISGSIPYNLRSFLKQSLIPAWCFCIDVMMPRFQDPSRDPRLFSHSHGQHLFARESAICRIFCVTRSPTINISNAVISLLVKNNFRNERVSGAPAAAQMNHLSSLHVTQLSIHATRSGFLGECSTGGRIKVMVTSDAPRPRSRYC